MRIRTKLYRYLISGDFLDNGNKEFFRDIAVFNRKINIGNVEKLEKYFEKQYGCELLCINNIVLL